jgi:hypothetical protein
MLLLLSFGCVTHLCVLFFIEHYNNFVHATYLIKSMSAVKRKSMKAKYLVAILLLLIISCKKESARLTDDLQGKWELASSDGAWSGHVDYEPGNGNTYTFISNNYERTIIGVDSIYTYSGTFKIYTGKPCDFAQEQNTDRI